MKNIRAAVLRLRICKYSTACALVLTLIYISLSSCVSGPKRENDSALDYLDGHKYQAGSPAGISPVVERQAPVMTVSGTLLANTDPLPLPLKYQTIVLLRGKTQVARSMTDSKGEFTLAGEIPNGSYTIEVVSKKFSLSQVVQVSGYKTEGLRLVVATNGP